MRPSIAIALLACIACAPLPYEPEEARSRVITWYPIGSDIDSVRAGLESRGWTCSEPSQINRAGAREPAVGRGVVLRCRVSQAAPVCTNRWVTDLLADSGRLSDVLITSDQICL